MMWVASLYPIVMVIGLALAAWMLKQRYRKSPLNPGERSALGIWLFVGCMIGAKLPFVWSAPPTSWPTLWLADGKTILGGIFGGYFAVELAKWWLGIRIRTGDFFAAPLAVAVSVGRFGCFVGGCCYGQVTQLPWGLPFALAGDDPGICRHPTQLYELLFHLTALALILWAEHEKALRGRRLGIYLGSYLVYRLITEWIRPEPIMAMGLTAYQWASIGLLLAIIAIEWNYGPVDEDGRMDTDTFPPPSRDSHTTVG